MCRANFSTRVQWGTVGYYGVSFHLPMPVLCSGSLLRSRQRKCFDVVKEKQSLMIKGKSGLLLFDQALPIFWIRGA